MKVGQDCILRAGFQPAPVGLFTNVPAGLPTRRTLQVAFPRRYRNASGASAAPNKRRGFFAGIHRIGYRVRNSLYFRFGRYSGTDLCQVIIYVESF